MNFNSKFWLKFSLINLLIVALLGLLMRYKIGFEFPYFNQKSPLRGGGGDTPHAITWCLRWP